MTCTGEKKEHCDTSLQEIIKINKTLEEEKGVEDGGNRKRQIGRKRTDITLCFGLQWACMCV